MFPKKFCQVRWLANVDLAARAIETFPGVLKYKQETKLPDNIICSNVIAAIADPLAMTDLAFFFLSAAALFEPFLRKYQTADPMMVFLHDDMAHFLRSLL